MQQFKYLFSQGKIGNKMTKNRIALAPMGDSFADPDGTMNERYIAYYVERAKRGVGIITPGVLCVDFPMGRGIPVQARIDTLQSVTNLASLAIQVHRYDALLIPQLHHGGAMATRNSTSGQKPVCVSSDIDVEHILARRQRAIEKQRELTSSELRELRNKFIAAGKYCYLAKCDGVEIQCCHGFFINQVLSLDFNARTDEYGGSLENRMRFAVEIIEGIRAECGEDFIIGARIPGFETVKRGLSSDDIYVMAQTFEKAGLNHLSISTGCITRYTNVEEGYGYEQGWRVKYAKAIKERVGIPVITAGVLRDPQICEDILARGDADFVAIGRPLLADPSWVEKAQKNKTEEIRHCICCLEGCLEHMQTGESISCTLNPVVGFEREFSSLPKAARRKKVVVIGGGAAGMEAAITAAEIGHNVTLLEKSGRLGGQLNLAHIPPTKDFLIRPLKWLQDELERRTVKLRLNFEADVRSVQMMDPDIVFIATGAVPSLPPIPGIEHAVQSWDILDRKVEEPSDKKLVIIGGGIVGCEIAMMLAGKNKSVTIVEMLPDVAITAAYANKLDVLDFLRRNKVEVKVKTTVVSIDKSCIIAEREGKSESIPADQVILASGSRAFGVELADQLRRTGIPVRILGDAKKPSKIINAVHDGFWAALSI